MNLTPPTDEELAEIIRDEPWFREVTGGRIADELQQLFRAMDDFDVRRCAFAAEVAQMLGAQLEIISQSDGAKRRKAMEAISEQAERVRGQLQEALAKFTRRRYRVLLPNDSDLQVCDDDIRTLAVSRVARFEETRVSVGKCVEIIDSMIERCNTTHGNDEDRKEHDKQ